MGKYLAKSFGVLASVLALCSLGLKPRRMARKGYAPGSVETRRIAARSVETQAI